MKFQFKTLELKKFTNNTESNNFNTENNNFLTKIYFKKKGEKFN